MTRAEFKLIIMKSKVIVIKLILICSSLSLYGIGKDSIHLAGRFSQVDTMIVREIVCKVIKNNNLPDWIIHSQEYKAPVKDRKFNISIPVNNELFYVSLFYVDSSGNLNPLDLGNGRAVPFLFTPGDSIVANIWLSKQIVDFSGRGSQKLQCQKNIYMLKHLPNGFHYRYLELGNAGLFASHYRVLDTSFRLQLDMKLALLESYKGMLPNDVYERIYYDCIGQHFFSIYHHIYVTTKLDLTGERLPFAKEWLRKLQTDYPQVDTCESAIQSAFYSGYLLLKERMNLRYLEDNDGQSLPDLAMIIETILKKYQGSMRDKLLMLVIVDLAKYGTGEYIDDVLQIVGKNESRAMLIDWRKRNQIGVAAYPFDLPDMNGERYRLDDFKGKTVVIDFWFTGCRPCIGMAKAMKPIADHFKNDTNVVFLSINVSETKESWKAGLDAGIYTFPGALHLSTYGHSSREHPLLKYYNYTGFPKLLLIDKRGNIISTNPPNPGTENGSELLRRLIAKYSGGGT